MTNFLPKNYEVPVISNYMKLQDGKNTFRILSPAIVGYEYWRVDNKPVRSREYPVEYPNDIRDDSKIKPFWAFIVWNYDSKQIQILEITQKTIMDTLMSLNEDSDWGSPLGYDLTITRSGSGLDTKYQTMPKNKGQVIKDISDIYKTKEINLEALFDNADPFAPKKSVQEKAEEVRAEAERPDGEIPFN